MKHYSDEVHANNAAVFARAKREVTNRARHHKNLTPIEQRILTLVAAGYSDVEARTALSMTKSVYNRVHKKLFRKVGITDRTHAIRFVEFEKLTLDGLYLNQPLTANHITLLHAVARGQTFGEMTTETGWASPYIRRHLDRLRNRLGFETRYKLAAAMQGWSREDIAAIPVSTLSPKEHHSLELTMQLKSTDEIRKAGTVHWAMSSLYKKLGVTGKAELIFTQRRDAPVSKRDYQKLQRLNQDERDVFVLMRQGKSDAKIKTALSLGKTMLGRHITGIFKALRAKNRFEVVYRYAGLGEMPPAQDTPQHPSRAAKRAAQKRPEPV